MMDAHLDTHFDRCNFVEYSAVACYAEKQFLPFLNLARFPIQMWYNWRFWAKNNQTDIELQELMKCFLQLNSHVMLCVTRTITVFWSTAKFQEILSSSHRTSSSCIASIFLCYSLQST